MELFNFTSGHTPLLISIPHAGTYVPPGLQSQFTSTALTLPDTDWHVDRLYAWAKSLGVHLLVATHSRYVVDLNRPSDNALLYKTATTGLVPLVQFNGTPLYRTACVPSTSSIEGRVETYWRPYHNQLSTTLSKIKAQYGYAILLDAHSIASKVPRLFEGQLPDLNLGTFNSQSASPSVIQKAISICSNATGYSFVHNGRFKGGYITRHYGNPKASVHALQLEMSQRIYMDESPPYAFLPDLANSLQAVLRALVESLLNADPEQENSTP